MIAHGVALSMGARPRARQPELPNLIPSVSWDRTAGSGFATPPSDPVRTTAKPAVRLVVADNQHFTSETIVIVTAAANDQGSLADTLGIEKVIFHFEGNTAEVTEPKWHSVATQRGTRLVFGWAVKLRKVIGLVGSGHLYVEAVPRDTTMQNRVIGPYTFTATDSLYDYSVEVAPSQAEVTGERYQTIAAASAWVKAQGAHNPLITITEPGTYDTGDDNVNAYDRTGFWNITASVPGVSLGKTDYTTDSAAKMLALRTRLRLFGSNLLLDYRYMTFLDAAAGFEHVLDGVTLTTTAPNGKNELWRGGSCPRNGALVAGAPIFLECDFTDVNLPANGASLVRGCTGDGLSQDIVTDALCVVHSTFRDHDQNFWNSDEVALTVQYTGAETTATLSRSGGNYGYLGGVFTATIGATSYTFDVGNAGEEYLIGAPSGGYQGTDGVGGYWVQDVVDWLNTLPDVTATISAAFAAEDRVAAATSLAGLKGQGFGGGGNANSAVDIKTAPVDLVWNIDTHGDFYQHSGGAIENVVCAFNFMWNAQAQFIYISPTQSQGAPSARDVLFFGNGYHGDPVAGTYYDPDALASQFGKDNFDSSHVVIAHNSLANQRFLVRTESGTFTTDSYSLIANCAFRNFQWSPSVLANLTVKNLHIHDGLITPNAVTNVARGGDENTLYIDAANGDFTPAGDLLTSGLAPVLGTDAKRENYPALAAPGALAAAATAFEPATGTGSLDPQADLIALVDAAAGQSAVHDYRDATNSGSWLNPDLSANGNDHYQTANFLWPNIVAGGADFYDSSTRVHQDIAGGTFTVVLAFDKDDASTAGAILTDQGNFIYAGYSQSQPTLAQQATVLIDGEAFTQQGSLYDALHQAGEKIVEIQGADFTGDTSLRIGRSGGLQGIVRKVIVLDHADFPDNLAYAQALAREAAAV